MNTALNSNLDKNRPRVFLDISIDDVPVGQIVIELCPDVAGKTSENFRALCTGDRGYCSTDQKRWYKGCEFHRIVPNEVCQSGDYTRGDGLGGESIVGSPFIDESFELKHKGAGIVSMVNRGPDTNGSQFYITFARMDMLDGAHVVCGYVVEGMPVLRQIEACGTPHGKPTKTVVIAHCGAVHGYA